MTRVDFYLLNGQDPNERFQLICKLAEKAVGSQLKVFIHSQCQEELQQLDEKLWDFRPMSFVPHALLSSSVTAQQTMDEPVHLSASDPHPSRQLLINLAEEVPSFFSRFERTLEVVNEAPRIQTAGRARYRFYQQRGYPLQHHKL